MSSSWRAVQQVGARLEHDDLVGQALGLDEQVGAHDHGVAVGGHLADEVEHGLGGLGVEARRRLVEEQQLGVVQHRPGQGQAGLHAGRVAADLLVEGVDDAEAAGGLADLVGGVAAQAVELGRVLHVVPAREAVVEGGLGRHDAAADADLLAVAGRVQPEGADVAGVGLERAGDDADRRGLAGAVRAEQHGDAALGHQQVEVRQRRVGVERLGDAAELDHQLALVVLAGVEVAERDPVRVHRRWAPRRRSVRDRHRSSIGSWEGFKASSVPPVVRC